METIIKPKKIAFCITCMNRLHHLQQTLEKNIQDNYLMDDVQFVLLDYNSKDGLEQWVQENMQQYIDTGMLVYYKTFEPEHYLRSHSRNMVFRLANAEILCNLDADNFLEKGFALFMIEEFEKNENIFYTSNLLSIDVFGKVCVQKQHFTFIRGYNEALQGYGCEDEDLFNRLEQSGLSRESFGNLEFYHYIRHSNEERVKNEPMSKNTFKIYIHYIKPYSSAILLLFKDFTFCRYILVDSPYLFYLSQTEFSKDFIADEKDVRLKEEPQKGNWSFVDNQIQINKDRFLECSDKIQFQNGDCYMVEDDELKVKIFMLISSASNHFQIEKLLSVNQIINPSGFGQGKVYKNFNKQKAIIL